MGDAIVQLEGSPTVAVGTTASGVPRSLVMGGCRFVVTDRPTRWLGRHGAWDFGPADPSVLALPALWRFQATPVDGVEPSIVVDVVTTGRGWILLGVVR
jgi:hypothetical protein